MKYSFIGDTTYSLLLYMLYASERMLENTTYYVGDNLAPLNIANKVVMPHLLSYDNKTRILYRLKCLKYRWALSHSKIYAQDHLFFSSPLIDNLPYTLLEDCPNFFTNFDYHQHLYNPQNHKEHIRNYFLGRISTHYRGYNPWCKKRIITSNRDKNFFDNLKIYRYEQVNIQQLWDAASENKKNFIIATYNLDTLNLKVLASRNVVIFSQPLCNDAHFSFEEQRKLFLPYIEEYGADNILVKLHPRDNFDYKNAYPGVEVLCTKAPQQLLSLMGLKFNVAITCCSSAVSSMDEDCEVIWIGSEVDNRIVKAYGHVNNPCELK
ncbi:MAG: glycosyltransferase family 52 [Prevotella sp.]|nr:glycosyltransferase family 52 [Prevotella sp.]